jgi:hypothetical protein
VLALAALMATGLAACGGGDSEGSTSTPAATSTEETTAAPTTTKDKGSGSSADFRTPGGDNSIQNFGEEADATETDAATVVLAGFLRAQAKGDLAKECSYLAKSTVAPLEELASRSPQVKGNGCAAVLAELAAASTSGSTPAPTMPGAIASLRLEGDRAFALYHGTHGADYFVPMVKEDGKWKVGALAPTEFP